MSKHQRVCNKCRYWNLAQPLGVHIQYNTVVLARCYNLFMVVDNNNKPPETYYHTTCPQFEERT